MSETLVLYTNPMSRGRIARWMLEETGVDYGTVILDYGTTMKAPDYLAINPMGKVPAIQHGTTVVTETAAICAYLADAFPEARLAPDVASRGSYYRWLFYTAGPFEHAVVNHSLGVDTPAEKQATVGYGSYEAVMDCVAYELEKHPFITGNQFTAADVVLGAQIGFGLMFGSIDKRAVFEDYFGRLSARDAWQRANALDEAAMPEST